MKASSPNPQKRRELSPIHPPSASQIAANRRNAQKSTGPRTAAGKRRAALNSRQRNLCPEEMELELRDRGEDPRDFRRLHRDLISIFQPHDPATFRTVELMAQAWWEKSRRIRRWEAAEPPPCQDLDARIEEMLRCTVQLLRQRHEWWRHRLLSVLGTVGSPAEVRCQIESRLFVFGAKPGRRKYPQTSFQERRAELIKSALAQILAEGDDAGNGTGNKGRGIEPTQTNPTHLTDLLSVGYMPGKAKRTQEAPAPGHQSLTAQLSRFIKKFKRTGSGTIADSV